MLDVEIDKVSSLSSEELASLGEMWRRCAGRIILSTTLARSGHPGGSLSSLHGLLVTYASIRKRPAEPRWEGRDRVVVSMGHISPAVYAVLAEYGYLSEDEFLTGFRRAGAACSGHVEQVVPGVEWNTGNLGQGLSAGCGMALAQKLKGIDAKTIVFMGDGEQQKGQVAEARRFATKFGLDNLIAVVDRNHLQIGGSTEEVMPVNVREEYQAAGWNVIYVGNGHDYNELFSALRRAWLHEDLIPGRPTLLVLRTVMGKGVSFMEGKAKYHGSPLPPEDAKKALSELGLDPGLLDQWQERRDAATDVCKAHEVEHPYPHIEVGEPREYGADVKTDCRSAYGNALEDLAKLNNGGPAPKVLGFSCDLEGSVKMQGLHSVSPNAFIECGIQEHHAAACAGAMSCEGFSVFFSTFGVFAVAETYNQHRLSDQNGSHLKIVSTHLGLDVGEDGPTHQSIDYIGLLNNLFGFSIFMPADPNQTDHIVRHVASVPGNCFVGMGRSKMGVVTTEDGKPFFGKGYKFVPGRADWLRSGGRATFITYGSAVPYVLEAWRLLKEKGVEVGVLNMASIKPLDQDAIEKAALAGPIVTVEDHVPHTGLGGLVAQVLVSRGVAQRVENVGVTHYGGSGKPADLYAAQGIEPGALAARMESLISE